LKSQPARRAREDRWLWPALERIKTDNAQGEFYLTDLLGIAVQEGQTVASIEVGNWQEALGINTPEQLREVEAYLSAA
jgi:bifunctional UDP-N-acetylglucosamine pyrophosphorylase/glucosamine-1-phosphate N-acetyltransferase